MYQVCGLNVHKDSIFACVMDEKGEKILAECFGTLTPESDRMCSVLISQGVGRIAVESASIYWMPIGYVLEDAKDAPLGRAPNGVRLSATMLLFVPHKSIVADSLHAPCGLRY
ncbi:hypothetical protein EZS27_023146 [termite gut metagenome]|uniref:Uncharacterized protein n=1 Tax=termite gut metagenome TaxID=433724 RepID=A0A5J4R4G0_9ZZZZ